MACDVLALPLWVSLGILMRICTVLHHRSWAYKGTQGQLKTSPSFSFPFSPICLSLYFFQRYQIASIQMRLCALSCSWSNELLLSLHFSCTLWKISDSELLCCLGVFLCVLAGAEVLSYPSALLPIILNHRLSREQGPQQEKPGCSFLLSLFYWQLYTSVSVHWAPPFLFGRIPSDMKRCELTPLYCCRTYPTQLNAFHE